MLASVVVADTNRRLSVARSVGILGGTMPELGKSVPLMAVTTGSFLRLGDAP